VAKYLKPLLARGINSFTTNDRIFRKQNLRTKTQAKKEQEQVI